MVPVICPECGTKNTYQEIFDENRSPLTLSCSACQHLFEPTSDELFQTLNVLDEKIRKIFIE